jgi:hypothetical protein
MEPACFVIESMALRAITCFFVKAGSSMMILRVRSVGPWQMNAYALAYPASRQDFQTTLDTLRRVILSWPDDTRCYPGHGSSFRLGDIRKQIESFLAKDHSRFCGDAVWKMSANGLGLPTQGRRNETVAVTTKIHGWTVHALAADYPECDPLLLYRGQERLKIDRIRCQPLEEFLRELKPSRQSLLPE